MNHYVFPAFYSIDEFSKVNSMCGKHKMMQIDDLNRHTDILCVKFRKISSSKPVLVRPLVMDTHKNLYRQTSII